MKQFPFRRHQRLLSSTDFKTVFDNVDGRVSHSAYLILAKRTEQTQPGRLGFVVSKKNLKRAVDRNAFKRQIRNQFRLQQDRFMGLDIIVMARQGSRGLPASDLQVQLNKSWQKLLDRCQTEESPKD